MESRRWRWMEFEADAGLFFDAKKTQGLLDRNCTHPGNSIYGIAKHLGLQYRRAHDHAEYLVATRKIRAMKTVENGHQKFRLYPVS